MTDTKQSATGFDDNALDRAGPATATAYPLVEAILVAGADGIVSSAEGWTELTGLPASDALGAGWLGVLEPPCRSAAQQLLVEALASGQPCSGAGRLRQDSTWRQVQWCVRPVLDGDWECTGAVISFTGVPASNGDGPVRSVGAVEELTWSQRRRRFEGHVRDALARSARSGVKVAVLHLHVHGTTADGRAPYLGEAGVAVVVGRFRAVLPPLDVIVHGHHDYLVLCENLTLLSEGGAIAARLARALDTPLMMENRAVGVGASVGVAVTDDPGVAPETLVRRAGENLQRSQELGRGPVRTLVRRSYQRRKQDREESNGAA